ncbi:hypothetical protein GFV14_00197 [Candidatus Hartigia pinicola]|nr:hypothetical protein GFV14_00197 [Candidatus Hartigia pinicola]
MIHKEKNYLLSLIIPVFNRESSIYILLVKMMKSLPNSVEIIIINDGSTDNTINSIKSVLSNSCQEIQVKVIQHENNLGVSIARNTGLKNANGTYIGFIDSDDDIVSNYFELLMPIISQLKYDIISFDFYYKNQVMKPNYGTSNIENVFSVSHWYLFSRIYKKKLWENEQFEPFRRYEDIILLPYIYIKAISIKHVSNKLYIYHKSQVSITQQIQESDIQDLYFAIDKSVDFIQNKATDKQAKLFVMYLINIFFLTRKYIKKINGYYCYDERFYNLTYYILKLIKQYNLKVSSSKIRKFKYCKLHYYFSKLKYKLQLKKKNV